MSASKSWWLFSIIRIGLFAIVFAIVWMLGGRWWLAVILAALISMAISIIALDPLRQRAAEGLHEWRTRERTEDSIIEDDIIDENPTLLNPLDPTASETSESPETSGTPRSHEASETPTEVQEPLKDE